MGTEQDVTGTNTEAEQTETAEQTGRQAEEATAEEAKEGQTEGETPEPNPEEEKRKQHNRDHAEKRLTNKRLRELELENAYLKGLHEGSGGKGGTAGRESGTVDLDELYAKEHPEPDPDKFDTTAELLRAQVRWETGRDKWIQKREADQGREAESHASFVQKLDTQRTRGEEKYEDFEEVMGSSDFSDSMFSVIVEAENGEDVAYYLNKNPNEKTRIEKLSPFLQAKEIGRIEAGLQAGNLQIKKTTGAPPPPSTVGGKGNTGKRSYMDENLSTEERIAMSRARKGVAAGK